MTQIGPGQFLNVEAMKLRSLADELQNIATALLSTRTGNSTDVDENSGQTTADDETILKDLAQRFYRSRRMRSRIFNDDYLFGEPAWDIMLDLFAAQADGKRLSVTAACIGASVPTSTALRWLLILEERGLVRRENDPKDARRVFLELTKDGFRKMTAYFRDVLNEGVARY